MAMRRRQTASGLVGVRTGAKGQGEAGRGEEGVQRGAALARPPLRARRGLAPLELGLVDAVVKVPANAFPDEVAPEVCAAVSKYSVPQ